MGAIRRALSRGQQLLRHVPVMARRARSGYYGLPSQRQLLRRSGWNVLVVLDACRQDFFRGVTGVDALTVRSLAPCTRVWIAEFGKLLARAGWPSDVVWFTANPVVDRDCARYRVPGVRLASVWRTRWARHGEAAIPAVHPEAVNEEVRAYLAEHGQPERMIVHYAQPHAPYIGRKELPLTRIGVSRNEFDEALAQLADPEQVVAQGGLAWDDLRAAYAENVKLVWEAVGRLMPSLKGRVVVTSDHGELLGEGGRFGHECPWPDEELRRVPWLASDRGAFDPAPPADVSGADASPEVLRERLKALGYV